MFCAGGGPGASAPAARGQAGDHQRQPVPNRETRGARRSRHAIAQGRRHPRRGRLAVGSHRRSVRAAGAAGGITRLRSHRGSHPLRRRSPLYRRSRIRVACRQCHRNAARCGSVVRRRQLPGDSRYLPRFAQRLHVPDHAAWRQARTAGLRRRRRRRARHHGERQSQLGWRVGRGGAHRRSGLDRRDRDSVQHGAVRAEGRPGLGRELPAPHPP